MILSSILHFSSPRLRVPALHPLSFVPHHSDPASQPACGSIGRHAGPTSLPSAAFHALHVAREFKLAQQLITRNQAWSLDHSFETLGGYQSLSLIKPLPLKELSVCEGNCSINIIRPDALRDVVTLSLEALFVAQPPDKVSGFSFSIFRRSDQPVS